MTTAAIELLAACRSYLEALNDPIVRDFTAAIDWMMPARPLEPAGLSCLGHLDRAVSLAPTAERPLVELLARHRNEWRWGQTYTSADFGQHFMDNYGWVELFGTRGHFANDRLAAGFLLLGPDITYPDHHHIAEELYVPLTGGTEWRKGEGGFVVRRAGEIIHHPSNVSHAMRTGVEPLVALYVWRGGPLAQKSTIGAAGNS
jgi:hypothetical protein